LAGRRRSRRQVSERAQEALHRRREDATLVVEVENRTMKASIGAVVIAIGVTAATAAPQNLGRLQRPDSLLLQGPGSDIGATVSILPEGQRPQGLSGVVIEQVTRGGPADDAGLRRCDIVTEFDAVAITDPVQFGKVVRDTPPGRRVKVIVWREGTRREILVAPIAGRPQ
jgi:hypothetical protein